MCPAPTCQQLVRPTAVEPELLGKPTQIVISKLLGEVPGTAPVYSPLPEVGRLQAAFHPVEEQQVSRIAGCAAGRVAQVNVATDQIRYPHVNCHAGSLEHAAAGEALTRLCIAGPAVLGRAVSGNTPGFVVSSVA